MPISHLRPVGRSDLALLDRRKLILGLTAGTVGVAASESPVTADPGDGSALEANKAVILSLHEGVQRDGDFALFDRLFADNYIDRTPFGDFEPNREGTRRIYQMFRAGFGGWRAEIHHMIAEADLVTTYKTYFGVHRAAFMGVAPTGRVINFDAMDIMRIRGGAIVEHWGIADGTALMQRLRA